MGKTYTVETLDSKDISSKVIPEPYNRSLQLILDKTDGDNVGDFTFLLSTLFPYEGKTDYHTHPVDELIFICSGYGHSVDENGEKTPLKAGSVIYAKAEKKHQCVNESPETMRMACIYIPALPEELVKKIRSK
ncbi:MAG: cupin domain-containing protein [Deltaproteobacteria bacterium]|jgi:quercetin dioxygenase-like cupin family protein|nr:cupin domain-containing protein [Deltaproteobacteria bacterium]MBT4525399.1 cupin domain-containing protein [Deltaproteobacteria bacterium]